MRNKITEENAALLVLAALAMLSMAISSIAAPAGPIVTIVGNESGTAAGASLMNSTGGSITTMNLNSTSQNSRWKGFLGNVSGKLTLDDSNNNTIYDWSLSLISGEVFATTFSGQLNWTGVNCTNQTIIRLEDINMNHTNPSDNISKTFEARSHSQLVVGTNVILANSCYSLRTYVNDSAQSTRFEEVVLYDGTNLTNGNQIYATILEQDYSGFNGRTYDFQMIVPENGAAIWSSSTAYYFYVELT